MLCNHLEEEEKAGCFAIIVLRMYFYYKCSVVLPHGAVGLSSVCYCGISYRDHTHLLFHYQTLLFIMVAVFVRRTNILLNIARQCRQ